MRPIVRTLDTLSGRWRIDGTQIAIAAIRQDHRLGMSDIGQQYRDANLTEEEIEAALAFEFPAIRETEVEHYLSSIIVHCECGENTPSAASSLDVLVECVCGRLWRVSMTIERVIEPGGPESITGTGVL